MLQIYSVTGCAPSIIFSVWDHSVYDCILPSSLNLINVLVKQTFLVLKSVCSVCCCVDLIGESGCILLASWKPSQKQKLPLPRLFFCLLSLKGYESWLLPDLNLVTYLYLMREWIPVSFLNSAFATMKYSCRKCCEVAHIHVFTRHLHPLLSNLGILWEGVQADIGVLCLSTPRKLTFPWHDWIKSKNGRLYTGTANNYRQLRGRRHLLYCCF